MLANKLRRALLPCPKLYSYVVASNHDQCQHKPVQVTLVGAASNIGANVALLLKKNYKISKLNIYDDDETVLGIGCELTGVPGGPAVSCYSGFSQLPLSLANSNLILMVSRAPRRRGFTRDDMLSANASAIQRLCRAVAERAPEAFLGISTNPVNSIIPFASAMLMRFKSYNPYKVLGITEIDTCRCRALAATALGVNPSNLYIPVIGGHSEDTIVPLFSAISPKEHSLDSCQADTLTRCVRKAGTSVLCKKKGLDSSILGMAWSVAEFADKAVDAIRGYKVVTNCFVANPHYGTRYFGGPVTIGIHGVITTGPLTYTMNSYESELLQRAVPILNTEVDHGEDYVRVIECLEKRL